MNTRLLKLRVKRFFRRSSNRLIEQIHAAVQKLEANLEALDREQDEANALAKAEIEAIELAGQIQRDQLKGAIKVSEETERTERDAARKKYADITEAGRAEHAAAAKVRDNLKAIVE